MKYRIFILFCLSISSQSFFSQIRGLAGGLDGVRNTNSLDSLPDKQVKVKLSGKTNYKDYKIISFKNDTTYIDTTLSIKKEYKFNFLRKDIFGLLPFHNQGQTFTTLAYDFRQRSLFPDIGFAAKNFAYLTLEDIKYYQVATPTTEIMYRTGMEQGQILDALFTVNFSKRFNVALEYKGIRSLGKYRGSLASQGSFITSFHYQTKKGQYSIRGHSSIQDLNNHESGGLTPDALREFINDNPNFSDNRGRLDINLENTENLLDVKRYYFEQQFKLFSTKDSSNQREFTNLKLGHSFVLENKFYTFKQARAYPGLFGKTTATGKIENTTNYEFTNNQVFLDFNSKYILGNFRVNSNYATYNYGYKYLINTNVDNIDKIGWRGKTFGFGASWKAKISDFHLNAKANISPGNSRLSGNYFYGAFFYKKADLFTIKADMTLSSKYPNFNFLLHQSVYDDYNWQNNFIKINRRNIGGSIESKWGNVYLNIDNIDNYTYFDSDNKPRQATQNINYLKLKFSKQFKVSKFALDNTLLYQNLSSGSSIIRVPEFVTRNTLYYSDSWFKGKPIFVQIGVTFRYFTKYKMNAYNPLLSEFVLQDQTSIGYPMFDAFFNARVRRTRIYFKIDNFSSMFMKKNYFSAPNYPYRDFVIRFGVVWNWFI